MKRSLWLIALVSLFTACGSGQYQQGAGLRVEWPEQLPDNNGSITTEYYENGTLKSISVTAQGAILLSADDSSSTGMKVVMSKASLEKIHGTRDGMLDNTAGVAADGLQTEQQLDKIVNAIGEAAAKANPTTGVVKAAAGGLKKEPVISPVIKPE